MPQNIIYSMSIFKMALNFLSNVYYTFLFQSSATNPSSLARKGTNKTHTPRRIDYTPHGESTDP